MTAPATCTDCGTPYQAKPDRCEVCGGRAFSTDGLTAARRAVVEQIGNAPIVGVKLAGPPRSALGAPPDQETYILIVVGVHGDDWAAYAAPAAWIEGAEDTDAALEDAARRGVKLLAREAVDLFPFMNPHTYRS